MGSCLIRLRGGGRSFFFGRHGGFEASDALAQSFAEFGKLLGAEYEQGDSENYQHVHWLKQSFKQFEPPLSIEM
jgi:hypothetical protein